MPLCFNEIIVVDRQFVTDALDLSMFAKLAISTIKLPEFSALRTATMQSTKNE
jgi:hypothetical protein